MSESIELSKDMQDRIAKSHAGGVSSPASS